MLAEIASYVDIVINTTYGNARQSYNHRDYAIDYIQTYKFNETICLV